MSCGGQWAETQVWHFDFDSSRYNDVINILKGLVSNFIEDSKLKEAINALFIKLREFIKG